MSEMVIVTDEDYGCQAVYIDGALRCFEDTLYAAEILSSLQRTPSTPTPIAAVRFVECARTDEWPQRLEELTLVGDADEWRAGERMREAREQMGGAA